MRLLKSVKLVNSEASFFSTRIIILKEIRRIIYCCIVTNFNTCSLVQNKFFPIRVLLVSATSNDLLFVKLISINRQSFKLTNTRE